MRTILLPTLLLLAGATPARLSASPFPQEPGVVRIEARVLASSPGTATLDRGTDALIEPGDRARLHPVVGAVLEGRVVRVGERDCEVRLDQPLALVDIGMRAEVFVPDDRRPAERPAVPGAAAQHPEWARPPDEWAQGMPLLASVEGRKPEEREREFHGRLTTSLDLTRDQVAGDRRYLYSRTGADLQADNPFGHGGRLQIDFEVNHRADSLPDAPDGSETRLRIDRLSWAVGGDRHDPRRWEFGRFLHHDIPEFGVVDGGEFSWRPAGSGGGTTLGTSLGFLPELDSDFGTGQDLQTAAFGNFAAEDGIFRAGGGLQKTWHDGAADRDLVLARASWSPPAGFNAYASAWVDYYGAADAPKSSGPELTQFLSSVGWRAEGGDGLRLGFSRMRIPLTLRLLPTGGATNTLIRNQTDRIDLSGWKRLDAAVRLSARLSSWSDEDGSGGGGEVRADWRALLPGAGDFGVALFTNEGQFSTVSGVRADADWNVGAGSVRLGWETAQSDQDDFDGSQESLLQHSAEIAWDLYGASGWSFSTYAEQRFGDAQDSLTLGFYLQHRF